MSAIDTADHIRHTKTGERFTVACVHGEQLYTCGNPSRTLRVDQCEIVHKASADDRLALLRAMAEVKSSQHRPVCARAALAAIAERFDDFGCC